MKRMKQKSLNLREPRDHPRILVTEFPATIPFLFETIKSGVCFSLLEKAILLSKLQLILYHSNSETDHSFVTFSCAEVRALEDSRVEEDQARQGGLTQRSFGSLDRWQLKTWIVWAFVLFSFLISPMVVCSSKDIHTYIYIYLYTYI